MDEMLLLISNHNTKQKCNFNSKVNLGSMRKYGTPNMHIAIIGTEKVANMLTFSCQSFLEKRCHTFLKEDFYNQKTQTKIYLFRFQKIDTMFVKLFKIR